MEQKQLTNNDNDATAQNENLVSTSPAKMKGWKDNVCISTCDRPIQ